MTHLPSSFKKLHYMALNYIDRILLLRNRNIIEYHQLLLQAIEIASEPT